MDQRVILTPFLQIYTDTPRPNQDSCYAVLDLHSTNKATNQHYTCLFEIIVGVVTKTRSVVLLNKKKTRILLSQMYCV